MILLQSADNYRKLGELDPESGRIEWRFRGKGFNPPHESIRGFFSKYGRHNLCLYRFTGVLHFRINKIDFKINDDTKISLKDLRFRRRQLIVLENNQEVYNFVYFRPINLIPLSIDPTPFVDEEDFDFGLFVKNVINNPDRRSNIFQD